MVEQQQQAPPPRLLLVLDKESTFLVSLRPMMSKPTTMPLHLSQQKITLMEQQRCHFLAMTAQAGSTGLQS